MELMQKNNHIRFFVKVSSKTREDEEFRNCKYAIRKSKKLCSCSSWAKTERENGWGKARRELRLMVYNNEIKCTASRKEGRKEGKKERKIENHSQLLDEAKSISLSCPRFPGLFPLLTWTYGVLLFIRREREKLAKSERGKEEKREEKREKREEYKDERMEIYRPAGRTSRANSMLHIRRKEQHW